MRAAVLAGQGELFFEDVPIPAISDDEVLVEVKYCGICGSDLHSYRDYPHHQKKVYIGHEFSGVIAKVGKNVTSWKPGERVSTMPTYICNQCYACRRGRHWECEHKFEHCLGVSPGQENAGAFAKYVRVPIPEWRLYRLPNELSMEEGALVEPLACSVHGVKVSGFSLGEHAMILGAGPIGLGVVACLKNSGAGLIIVEEISEKRAELARNLGADHVFNPQKVPDIKEKVFKLTNGKGVDVVFDCSGVPQVFLRTTEYLRYAGRVVVLGGIGEEKVPATPGIWIRHEWSILTSGAYGPDGFPVAIELLKRGFSPIRELITSKIKLSNLVGKGFNLLSKPGHNEIKILVEPDE